METRDLEPIDADVLEIMRSRATEGARWAAFENADMSHPELGRLTFLKVGKGCTFSEAPKHAPDSAAIGLGWRYLYVGFVNLETGKVERASVEREA